MDLLSFNIVFSSLLEDMFELFPLMWPVVFVLSLLYSIRCIVRQEENKSLLVSVILCVFSLMVMLAPYAYTVL